MVLKIGSRGPEVARLQRELNARLSPLPRLKEDGEFGRVTAQAIEQFQRRAGLPIDGVAGPSTLALLGLLPGPGPVADR